jgi:Methyltransferase TRM13
MIIFFISHNDNILSLTYTAAAAAVAAAVELDSRVKGVAIATCCHHACVWGDYTGAHWLLAQGITLSDLLFYADYCVCVCMCLFVCFFNFIL